MRISSGFLAIVFLTTATGARLTAAETYLIEAPRVVMAGDPETRVVIKPLNGRETDRARHAVRFRDLPAGVFLEGPGDAAGSEVEGPTSFRLRMEARHAGSFVPLRVENRRNAKAKGGAFVFVEKTVARFDVHAFRVDGRPRLGRPLEIQITAKDEDGAVVSSFNGVVDLSADFGAVEPAVLNPGSFRNGIARVNIAFTSADPLTSLNRLWARARTLYDGQSARAEGFIELGLDPRGGDAP